MKKTRKFGHIISLSKPPSVSKKFKYPTSLPSPKNSSKKFTFQVQSPKKEDELILIKRKFLNRSKHQESTSNYLSFAQPFYKKNSFNANTSIKSQLILSSIDMSLINKDTSKEKKIVMSSSAMNNSISHTKKKNPQTSMNSRKTSCDKTLNNNNNQKKSNTNRLYSKLLEKYSKENVKKMIGLKGTGSQIALKTKRKIASTACCSPTNMKNGSICFDNNTNMIKKKKTSKSNSIQFGESIKTIGTASMIVKKYSTNHSIKKENKSKNNSKDKKYQTTKNSSTNLHNICVNVIASLKQKSSNRVSKPTSKPTSKSKSKPKTQVNSKSKTKSIKPSSSNSNYKSLITNNSLLQSKINSLLLNGKKEIFKIQQNYVKHFSGLNSPKKKNIILSPSSLRTLSELPVNPSLSTLSSSNNDKNYYLSQSNKLSTFIKEHYQKYNKYPPTSVHYYKYGRLIGQGAFGKVNLGLNVLSGRVVAIKSFNKAKNNEDNKNKIIYETNLMKRLNHPSIVKILEMFDTDKYLLIIMEYINGGNLYSFVKKRRKLTEKTAKFLFYQIIQGIKYMHSRGVVHRDIKLENILIDLNNNVKICDFGIGKFQSNPSTTSSWILHEQCGTPMYIAPEILLSTKEHGYEAFPVDLWSSGIALYIMLSGTLPFTLDNNVQNNNNFEEANRKQNNELQYAIIHQDPNPISGISNEAKDLLRGLLDKNPKTRYTPDQVLHHPWLNENFNNNPDKYHLFTKAEMIMLSKTYIDYRFAKLEDLKESFTLANLNSDDDSIPVNMKNSDTKSQILAPFNSMISSYNDDDEFESDYSYRNNLMIENDHLVFSNKVKEYNMNYELNNNGELDNGILINSKFDMENNTLTTESVYYFDEEKANDIKTQGKIVQKENEESLMNKMEKFGYNRKYVKECLDNNELCYATAVYYLMKNYEHID